MTKVIPIDYIQKKIPETEKAPPVEVKPIKDRYTNQYKTKGMRSRTAKA